MFNRNDSRYGTVMMVGIGLTVGSFLLAAFGFFLFLFIGTVGLWMFSVIAPIMLLAGILTMGYVLWRGLSMEKHGDKKGGLRIEHGAWVQARFAIMPGSGEMLFSEEFFDPDLPGLKLFVRLKFPDGRVDEPKTSISVWRMCAEGFVGVAEIQGDWLTRYTPQPRPSAPPPA